MAPARAVTASLIVATLTYAPFAPMVWPEYFPAFAAWSVVGLGVLCTAAAFLVFFAGDRGLSPRHIATAQTALVRQVGVGS